MPLPTPSYITAAKVRVDEIRYLWDDFGDQLEGPLDEDFVARLEAMTERATLAFMCASLEWLVERLAHLCGSDGPGDYAEAAWAMTVDLRYRGLSWLEYEHEDEWIGPVRTPLREGIRWLEIGMEERISQANHPATYAVLLSNLVDYVMPDPEPHRQWREQVLARLSESFPLTVEDREGDVVPREMLDPEVAIAAGQTEELINGYLYHLDHRRNPFLRSPELMVKGNDEFEPYEGTPYRFSMAEDRKRRGL